MLQVDTLPALYTYPARPIQGGPLQRNTLKTDDQSTEPKWNGWRVMLHLPTRSTFNRHGQPLSIGAEFESAIDELSAACLSSINRFEWLDCEGLDRRHAIGRGTLIVLDAIPLPSLRFSSTYLLRRAWLKQCAIAEAVLHDIPERSAILTTSYPGSLSHKVYEQLAFLNAHHKADVFEGIVTKRNDSTYPIQLRNSKSEYAAWMKHRWRW